MANQYTGSCLCGQLRYEVEGSFESFYLCHCRHCQKDTGSAHSANLFSASGKLRWLTGSEGLRTYTLPGTRHAKSFCGVCSSALPSLQLGGTLLVVPAGSLEGEISLAPTAHLFCASRAGWDRELEKVVQLPGLPG